MATEATEAAVPDGELELTGRIPTASNATFLARIGETDVVYKPIRGEQPLWDFPGSTLAFRERAAYLVSQQLGWNIVPHTWIRDGSLGPGMVQLWQTSDSEQTAIDLVSADAVPDAGWRHVLDGQDEDDHAVSLIHEDSAALRRMAVFDIVVNNADRKGAHVLPMPDGHRFGVDHGLTFHEEHKLRTVLWGWIDVELSLEEIAGVERVRYGLLGDLRVALRELISAAEIDALLDRCERLLASRTFPAPQGHMPAVPWPLF
jgi:uncharacterized repeat protein (TIGR03843 family)